MRNSIRYWRALGTALVLICAALLPMNLTAQIFETETARQLRTGQLEVGAGYEFQHSKEGNEAAIPFAFELGLTNRLGLLVMSGHIQIWHVALMAALLGCCIAFEMPAINCSMGWVEASFPSNALLRFVT